MNSHITIVSYILMTFKWSSLSGSSANIWTNWLCAIKWWFRSLAKSNHQNSQHRPTVVDLGFLFWLLSWWLITMVTVWKDIGKAKIPWRYPSASGKHKNDWRDNEDNNTNNNNTNNNNLDLYMIDRTRWRRKQMEPKFGGPY